MITDFVSKLIRTISIRRVLVWVFTALMAIVLYTAYENRVQLSSALFTPDLNISGETFEVSRSSKHKIDGLVAGDSTIIGVAVMSADIRLNEARLVYFKGDDTILNRTYEYAQGAGADRLPLFTSSDDNNTETIKLINGIFYCGPAADNLMGKFYPDILSTSKTICRGSIPSYYGYFSGFVMVYLSVEVSSDRAEQLKLIVERLSNDIYFNDVASHAVTLRR